MKFVFLRGDYGLIEKQLRTRHGHFVNATLLRSLFDDPEEPQSNEGAITIELGRTPRDLAKFWSALQMHRFPDPDSQGSSRKTKGSRSYH